ncbi:MAG: hypothetical protein DRN57_06520 [Thermoplasmata archaeon]|nr:MAG: hypothetical protein DRN57_06520 [Thermoplasmata archaeon]
MKLKIFVVIFFLIILAPIPTILVLMHSSSSTSTWEPTIIIDKDILRVNEIVNITIKEPKKIDNCTWEIDGKMYYGKCISVSFNESKNYSIKLTLKIYGNKKNIVKNIEVYNQNEEYILQMKGFQNYRYIRDIDQGRIISIKPGISYPNVEIHIHSDKAVGILGPKIELWIDQDNGKQKVLLYEKGNYFNEPLDFHITISSDVLNDYSLPFQISIGIKIEEGKIDDWTIEIDILYK